jgi:hypothetical protein
VSVLLSRSATLETFEVEANNGTDDQGRPNYDSPVAIEGRVVREDTVVMLGTGESVTSVVTVWVNGTETPLPTTDDRLTFADGLVGIVVEYHAGKTLNDVLDHVRVKAREQ